MPISQRLDKLLSNGNFGTRTEVKKLIRSGRVSVMGKIIKNPDIHINEPYEGIEIDGNLFCYKQFLYIMMNKPAGVVSAVVDNRDKTVFDILPHEYNKKGLFPAGRLDKDTEGLLILTDDGQLSHKMLSPKNHVPKTYYAKIAGNVTVKEVDQFIAGVTLDDGYICMPAYLNIIQSGNISEITLTIHEGKFHQVKRMFEAVNQKVIYLKRIKMGNFSLDESLALGDVKELSMDEVSLLSGQA